MGDESITDVRVNCVREPGNEAIKKRRIARTSRDLRADRQAKTKAEGQPEHHVTESKTVSDNPMFLYAAEYDASTTRRLTSRAEGAPPRARRRHLRRGGPHQERRRQGQDRRQDREAHPARWLGWPGRPCSDRCDLSPSILVSGLAVRERARSSVTSGGDVQWTSRRSGRCSTRARQP